MRGVEIETRSVGHAAHVAEDEGYGAGWGDRGVGGRAVEVREDGGETGLEEGGCGELGEEGGCGGMGEVVDLKAEEGGWVGFRGREGAGGG